jgi:hypothetical protein
VLRRALQLMAAPELEQTLRRLKERVAAEVGAAATLMRLQGCLAPIVVAANRS